MRLPRLPAFNAHSCFYGGGLLVGLLGDITLGPPIIRQMCTAAVIFVGAFAWMRIFSRNLLERRDWLVVVALLSLFVFSLFGDLLYRTHANLVYSQYFLFNLSAFAIVAVLSRNKLHAMRIVVLWFLAVLLLFALLQVTYIFLGFGLDPTMVQLAEDGLQGSAYHDAGVRSFFFNQNDMAVACCLLLFYFLYGCVIGIKLRTLLAVILAALVVLSGSRSGVLVMAFIVASYYLTSTKRLMWLLAMAAIATMAMLWLASSKGSSLAGSYFGAKIVTLATIIPQYFASGVGGVADGSISLRTSTYLQFVHKLGDLGMGSFLAQSYGHLLKGDWLMAQDPHSLLVELGALYGYAGVAAFSAFFWWIFTAIARLRSRLSAAISVSLIFVLSCVSSSCIGRHAFWILLFMYAMCARNVAVTMRETGAEKKRGLARWWLRARAA